MYVVQEGDTMDSVAGAYGIPARSIAALNEGGAVTAGRVLWVPSARPPARGAGAARTFADVPSWAVAAAAAASVALGVVQPLLEWRQARGERRRAAAAEAAAAAERRLARQKARMRAALSTSLPDKERSWGGSSEEEDEEEVDDASPGSPGEGLSRKERSAARREYENFLRGSKMDARRGRIWDVSQLGENPYAKLTDAFRKGD